MGTYGKYGEVTPIKLPAEGQLPERECYDFYKDSKERGDTDQKDIFLQDALINCDQLFSWAQLAYQIFKSNSDSYWDHAGNGWDKDYGDGHYIDMIECLCNKHGITGGDDKYGSTGLVLTSSLNEVEQAAGKLAEDLIGRKLKAQSFINQATLEPFHDKTDQQTVFYTIAGIRDRYGKTYQFGYTVLGLAFYNFRLKVVSDGTPYNTAIGNMTIEEAIKRGGIPGFTYTNNGSGEARYYDACNAGREASSETVTLTMSLVETEANTITNSKEYSFSEMIGASYKFGDVLKGGETALQLQFTAGQVIGTAYSKEKSVSKEISDSSSVTTVMPPHTKLAIRQQKTNTVTTLNYDCPVMIQFDVAVFSMCGTCYDDNAAVHTFSTAGYDQRSFITLFAPSAAGDAGEDASENLYMRNKNYSKVSGYEKTYGFTKVKSKNKGVLSTELNWETILKQGAAKSNYGKTETIPAKPKMEPEKLIENLTTKRPMSPAGAKLTETGIGVSSKIERAIPLYTLDKLRLLNGSPEYNIGIDDRIYHENWEIEGYNLLNVPFYGFDSSFGEWILVDENGEKLLDKSVASIEYEPLTNVPFIQGNGEGTVYAKYLIRDNYYTSAEEKPITNNTIHTVIVKVMVHPRPLEGHITVSGEVRASADGAVINLEAVETLTVMVYDEREREIPVPVIWEAQESYSRGIQVLHNQMSLTRPGVFHIRAVYENLESDWVEVHALKV